MVTGQELESYLFGWQVHGKGLNLPSLLLTPAQRKLALSALVLYFDTEITLQSAIRQVCFQNHLFIPLASGKKIEALCNLLASGFGPLGVLLEMKGVEEISVSGLSKPVRIYLAGKGWADTGLIFTSEQCIYHFANKISLHTGRKLTLSNPVLNSFLPDGSRLHLVSSRISGEPALTLRKFRHTPFSLVELGENGTISKQAAGILQSAIAQGSSVIVAGNTGSGKTTLLNAILSTLPASERFVMVEDVSEISLPCHKHKVRLLADSNAGVSLNQLVYESLRMRPDRLVVSEVRNEQEVKAFHNALLSGPGKSCFTTFHANSAHEALARLQLLGFRQIDLNSIGLIVVQKRFGTPEKRRVVEIARVEKGKALPLFLYNLRRDSLEITGFGKAFIRRLPSSIVAVG